MRIVTNEKMVRRNSPNRQILAAGLARSCWLCALVINLLAFSRQNDYIADHLCHRRLFCRIYADQPWHLSQQPLGPPARPRPGRRSQGPGRPLYAIQLPPGRLARADRPIGRHRCSIPNSKYGPGDLTTARRWHNPGARRMILVCSTPTRSAIRWLKRPARSIRSTAL